MDWKHVGTLPPQAQNRIWVQHWKWLGPELERLKRDELRALTDEEGLRRAIRVMGSRGRHARESAPSRTTSGLIQQQEIFLRARSGK